jgi:hypothetical protein
MAITIISSPNQFMAAYNQVPYTVSSNNTSQPNFNFIVDVNQTGGASNPLARLKYPAQPSSSQLTLDIGSVLKNYVSYDFDPNSFVAMANPKSRLNYFVQFRELYDNASGVPTLSGVLASDPPTPSSSVFKLAANAIFDFEEFNPNSFVDKQVLAYGFLNYQGKENIAPNQRRILNWFDKTRVAYFAEIGYNSGGLSPVFTFDISPLAPNEYLFSLDVLTLMDFIPLVEGNEFFVRLTDTDSSVIATKIFTYTETCSQYENVRLHYLNKLGGFDVFNFNKNTINAMTIDRKQFKAPLPIGYSKSDRLKTNYNTTINDRITINSDWITEEQSILLEQLATSPIIYLERSPTNFIAVNILNAEYEIKTFLTDRKMFNVTFEIEYSYSRYRQSL